jgi:cytochrome c oxidase subunit 1
MNGPRTPEERDRGLDVMLAAWADRPGFAGWLATLDHKRVARRYLATALACGALAGLLALLMRTQLSEPHNPLLGPAGYARLFTLHGSALILFALPAVEAIAIYLVPLMLGARAIAFPRLNAFGYWVYVAGVAALVVAQLTGVAPVIGRAGLLPPSAHSALPVAIAGDVDALWLHALLLGAIAAWCASVALAVTILALRAPGLQLMKMPLFAWSVLVASAVSILALPLVIAPIASLLVERVFDGGLRGAASGVETLPWPHVYRLGTHVLACGLLLPAAGMLSQIVETFTRRTLFGYVPMVLAMVAIGALSLWSGLGQPIGPGLFADAGMPFALPVMVLLFCWIATLWSGRPDIATPLLFALGAIVLFPIAGLAGVVLAATQEYGSYFDVAWLHYALAGGVVFPLMAALYFWFPKLTGRLLSESLGRMQFWLSFVGLNVTFLPMFVLGLRGMPSRVDTYDGGLGWSLPNLVASLGTWMIAAATLVFAANLFYALRPIRGGRPAGDNPWRASDLAWATHSPPPPYNFADLPMRDDVTWPAGVIDAGREQREVVLTTPLAAAPLRRQVLPRADLRPLWPALALLCMGLPSRRIAIVAAILFVLGVAAWWWPRRLRTLRDA